MADSRFFKNSGSLTLEAIATLTGAVATSDGAPTDIKRSFTDVAPLDTADATHISFLDNTKYLGAFEKSKAGACFVRPKFKDRAPKNMVLLITEQPYYCYAVTANAFYPAAIPQSGIAKNAFIAPTAKLGKDVRVDAGGFIGENASIGDGCWIGPNAVIGDSVEIGSHTRIGACATLSHALVGSRVIIHPGVHIGQDGFGFAPSAKGIAKVPQLGRVIIGNDVEIGAGTCIDRGAGPDTVIGDGTKIDNLVQIGHNVKIGRYAILVSQSGISGSTEIGDGVMLGGQAGISGHIQVGKGAKLAARAGVINDVPPGETYGGFPAIPVRDWHRQTVTVANLVKKKDNNE